MGRKAKQRQQRKQNRQQPIPTVTLTGKDADVFDLQMETDREWFEHSPESTYFRPQIDGEFEAYARQGSGIPTLSDPSDTVPPLPCDWTCVVDVGRVLAGEQGPPSGHRVRFACPAPLSPAMRALMAGMAREFILRTMLHQGVYNNGFA